MWGNRSFSGKKTSPKSKMNTTLPAFVISPISTRQRQPDQLNRVLSAAGPPHLSPFMPQIKRALGLEPDHKRSYGGIQRRHSFNTSSYQSSNSLPHVVLNKGRPLPLTERNSSMMRKSSTVRIAPPTPRKVISPSLNQLRNTSHVQEDRNIPDTQAVVTALKERRKRSITSQEEAHEVPIQHAKRRRQESQQSNASTSSMPSMPDNLPDLSSTDFSIRIETPNLQRPSRPSQSEMSGGWDPNSGVNSPRQRTRNNAIFSSLSSSRRFAMSKRRAEEVCLLETHNSNEKAQKRDPPKLSHFPSPQQYPGALPRTSTMMNGFQSLPMTNGHTGISAETTLMEDKEVISTLTQKCVDSDREITRLKSELKKVSGSQLVSTTNGDDEEINKEDELTDDQTKGSEAGNPTTPKPLPFLKKKTSLYSGLSQNSSFRKAQYANVLATLEDYDQDHVAENRRVQQMLNDVDSSFAPKEQDTVQPPSLTTTTTTISTTTTLLSVSTSGGLTSLAGSTAATTLPSVPKSPVQEVGDKGVTTAPSVTSSNPTLSGLLTQSNSSAVTSSSVLPALSALVSSVTSSTSSSAVPSISSTGNFSFGNSLASANANNGKAVTSSVGGSSIGGFNFSGTSTTVSSALSSASTHQTVGALIASTMSSPGSGLSNPLTGAAPTTKPATVGGFNFGASGVTSSSTLPTGVGFGLASSTSLTKPAAVSSQQTPASGFGFGTVTTLSSTQSVNSSQQSGGFNSGAPASSVPGGFGLSNTAAPGVSSAFSFGGNTASTPAKTTSGVSFGTAAPASAAPGGFTFNPASTSTGQTQSTGGFNFTPSTSAPAQTVGSTAPAPGGFTFNAATTAAAVAPNTGGFSFTGGAQSSGTASVFGSVNPTTTAAASAGFGGFSQPATTQATAGGFGFGGNNTAPSTGVGFGTNPTGSNLFGGATAGITSATPFTFNTGSASTAPSTTPFGLGTGTAKTTASTPFTFNAGSSTASTSANKSFSFGQAASSTSGTSNPFGGSNTATQGFGAFGSSNATPAFGSANQTPAFGTTNQAPAFGTTNPPPAYGSANQTPAFGSTNPPPAFGSTNQPPAFGSTNPPPAFGSTNQTPAFGSTNQTPAFGSTNQTPAFGSTTAQPSAQNQPLSSSLFGATANQSNSSVFGASANNSNSSVFGAGSNTATGFGKSQSMPSFGSTNNSSKPATAAFSFEGQTAPNVNPFAQGGPTTPAKQTGALFGAINTNSTPQNQTGSMFAFGQNNDSVKKGFDFSASTGGNAAPNTGGFNFASAASAGPVFNFGATASTPNTSFGTPAGQGSFSVGTGDAPRPPRAMAKGRRRVPRR